MASLRWGHFFVHKNGYFIVQKYCIISKTW
nr:MAG TPA: hypothetical protein [Caudoviricetes sp.]